MKKMGRPSKLPDMNLAQVEALAQFGLTQEEIARILGISAPTLIKYKKNPDFFNAIKKGQDRANTKVIQSLYKKATEHNDTTAMIFWLKNRMPDRWRDRHDQVISGEGEGGGIRIEIVHLKSESGNGNGKGKKE